MTVENNPARYVELSKPFDDLDEANEALAAFFEEVKAARVKFGIADVAVLVEVTIGEGARRSSASMQYGSYLNKLPMLARAYGAARQEHEELLGDLIEEGRGTVRGR